MGDHDGHRDRLRNRFLNFGMDALEDHEVLELLLFFSIQRKDTNALAHRLLNHFGSLKAVMHASFSDLMSVRGIGPNTAHLLMLCMPLCRRYQICQNDPKKPLDNVKLCAEYLKPYFFGATEEHAYLLCLDAKCKPICCRELSEGSATTTILPIRKAAQLALDCNAVSVILSHNHPGSESKPSSNDYNMTKLMQETLTQMGIQLADHIIFGTDGHTSIAETGFFY